MSSIQGLYTYGIAGQAVSQAWLGMSGQGIGVRGVPGSILGGNHQFWCCQFQKDDSEKVLGLRAGLICICGVGTISSSRLFFLQFI